MIVSFYDRNFKGFQNNASLVVDNSSYSLIRRGVDLDELKCTCEPFTENIQPTFLVVKNDRGNYVYACLAGIPQLNAKNQTEITGTDIKTMLKSDVVLDLTKTWANVNAFLSEVFAEWKTQVVQGSFDCELAFSASVGTVDFENMIPAAEAPEVYDAWEIFAKYLKYYGLFMETELDIVRKKVLFRVGASMYRPLTVKLWETGIYNYGKWIADINETQGCVLNTATGQITKGYCWILTSSNAVTTNTALRDIYPIKRKIVWKETDDSAKVAGLLAEANEEALKTLADSMFQENLEIENLSADFETKFNIYVRKGEGLYKSLPCGELHYDSAGLKKVQIGYRFTGLQFLL